MASILRRAGRAPAFIHRLEREARRRARALLAGADEEAATLRAGLALECLQARQEAAQAGREEGRAEAAAALLLAVEVRRQRLAALEREVAAAVLEVGKAVLGAELTLAPERVVELAKQALAQVRERREVLLRVHPEDAPLLRAGEGRLAGALSRGAGLSLQEDPALRRGDVVVEAGGAVVDARVEAQLAVLERRLAEEEP